MNRRWAARLRSSRLVFGNPLAAGLGRIDRRPSDADLEARADHQLTSPGLVRFPPLVGKRPPGRPVLDPRRAERQCRQPVPPFFQPRHHGREPRRSRFTPVHGAGRILRFEMRHGLFDRRQFGAGILGGM